MNPVLVLAVLAGVIVSYFLVIKPASVGAIAGKPIIPADPASNGVQNVVDPGIFDKQDPNVFGTTCEANRRVTNYGVRPEFNKDPYPLAQGCDCGSDSAGCMDPAHGNEHWNMCGPASKRVLDAYGGHHMLPHIGAVCTDNCPKEPPSLGRFWCRHGCGNPESVGLDIRSICTRCGA
jgi:hypothetical protein